MTMIKEIIMENIKGQNSNQRLTGKDIIIGPNGIGKTTRLQSLGITLLGYVPGQGKEHRETYKLCSDGEMTVGLVTGNFKATRTFAEKVTNHQDGSQSTSYTQDINVVPSKGEKRNRQKEDRINDELGSLPIMLDFQEFLNKSDNKRREFIYSLSPGSDNWDRDRVGQYLNDKLLTDVLKSNNPDQYNIMEQIVNDCMEQFPEGFDVQAGLQAMQDWAEGKRSHWRKEKEDAQGAVRKLADLKNQLEETDRNLKRNRKELDDCQKNLVKTEKNLSQAKERYKNRELRKATKKDLQRKIKKLEKELETFKKQSEDDLDKQIEDLKEKIADVDFSKMKKGIRAKIKNKRLEIKTHQGTMKELESAIGEARAIVNMYEKNLDTLKEQSGVCVIGSQIKCAKDFSKYKEHAEKEIKEKKSVVNKLKKEHSKYDEKVQALEADIEELENEINNLEDQERAQQKKNKYARNRIAKLTKKKEKHSRAVERVENKIESYQEQIQELEKEEAEQDPIAPIKPLEKQKSSLENRIEELKNKVKEQEKARNNLSDMKATIIDSERAQYYYLNFRSLVEALGSQGIQGELVKEILDPIRRDVQKNLEAVGINHRFYFSTENESGKEIFQFGWENEKGERLNFDALSTGQQMLLLIALMTTIIDRANPPVRILAIDNIENLDKGNFRKVLKGLNQLEDRLDNIILLGVVDNPNMNSWTVWDLSKEGGAADDSAA